MATIIFHINGNHINIQCQANESFEKILQKFSDKAAIKANNLFYIYNGNLIDKKLSFENLANSIDKERKVMDVLVYKDILNNFENEKVIIKEKLKLILHKYLWERVYLSEKINNWKDAILNECKNLFSKYENYITFVNLIIFNKSMKNSKYYTYFNCFAGNTTEYIEESFNSDKIEAQLAVAMFLKQRKRTQKDLKPSLNLAEKEFLNLAEGRTFEIFHSNFLKTFKNSLENEILSGYKYSLFLFYELSNKYNQSSKGFIIINKNKDDYYISKMIDAGESKLYLLFGKAQ